MSNAFEELVIETLKEVKGELVALGGKTEQAVTIAAKTLEQATQTNGRVTSLEGWKSQHTDVHLRDMADLRESESYQAGRDAERAKAKRSLAKLWNIIRPPVLTGVFIGITWAVGAVFLFFSEWSPW